MNITPGMLMAAGAPRGPAELFAPILDRQTVIEGDAYNSITSRTGRAMLLAQLSHESLAFTRLSESMDYDARRLLAVFPNRISPELAERLGRRADHPADQGEIANAVYGGEWGRVNLGNTEDGDGWMYRGAGLIQLTGRANLARFGRAIDRTTEQAALYARSPEGAVASALWFWRQRGLVTPAFRGDVVACTRIINPGQVRLAEAGNFAARQAMADRAAKYNRALAAT